MRQALFCGHALLYGRLKLPAKTANAAAGTGAHRIAPMGRA